jgi:hypothetical protein
LELKVMKRAGQVEAFSADKIKRGVMKAGGTAKLAGTVATNAAKWSKEKAKEGVISAVDLYSKVLELLYESDREVADSFKGFVKKY